MKFCLFWAKASLATAILLSTYSSLAQEPATTPSPAPEPTPAAQAAASPAPAPSAPAASAAFDFRLPSFTFEGGAWYMPSTSWSGKTSASRDGGGNLHFKINDSPFTTYEGGLINTNTSLSLGVSIDVDNNLVGRVNRIMGYVGFHGFFLRVQNATLKGTARWEGSGLTGQPSSYSIDSPYQNVQLIRMFDTAKDMFWGFGYSTVTLPQQVSVWGDKNNVYTNQDSVDPASKIMIYSLIFGADNLNWSSIQHDDGFGFWCFTQDMFGYGNQTVDPAVNQRVKAFYGGRGIPTSLETSLIDYTLTLGAKWQRKFKSSGVGVGLGYNVHGMYMMSGWNARGSEANDLNAYTTTFLAGHGPQLKVIGTW